jgi:NAD(P)-dependent dehydrogenase (short-subunit alcohol dehydrogenase family)
VSISREASDLDHENLTQIELDAVKGELPELDEVDGLVYCPGTINLKPFSRLSEEDFLNDFEINVLGAVRVLKAYEKALKKSDQASVVLFSTVASDMGMTFHASVAISKSGVEGLAKSLAAEWAPKIRVNVIAPTITDTTLASKILRNDAIREKMKERHPLKKILDPTEVAELAVYLLSDGSRSITGQVLKMDAGMLSIKV